MDGRAVENTEAAEALKALQATVDALLDPPGCEWNRAQTHGSLVTYLLEESFELVEAIEKGGPDDVREELGDVLYQVILHAGIAERQGEGFGLAEVVREVHEKIRRRHPHVFGDDSASGVDDIVRLWTAAKALEKSSRESAFDGIPAGLPALARAQKIRSRAMAADPDGYGDAAASDAAASDAEAAADGSEEEWGRRLLAEVDRASARGWDAERALRGAVRERERLLRSEEAGDGAAHREERRRGAPQPE